MNNSMATNTKSINICKHCQHPYASSLDKSSCRRSGYCSKECSLVPVFDTKANESSLTHKVKQMSLSSDLPRGSGGGGSAPGIAHNGTYVSMSAHRTTSTLAECIPIRTDIRPQLDIMHPKSVSPLPPPRKIPSLQQLCIKMLVHNASAITDLSGLDSHTGACILKEIVCQQKLNFKLANIFIYSFPNSEISEALSHLDLYAALPPPISKV